MKEIVVVVRNKSDLDNITNEFWSRGFDFNRYDVYPFYYVIGEESIYCESYIDVGTEYISVDKYIYYYGEPIFKKGYWFKKDHVLYKYESSEDGFIICSEMYNYNHNSIMDCVKNRIKTAYIHNDVFGRIPIEEITSYLSDYARNYYGGSYFIDLEDGLISNCLTNLYYDFENDSLYNDLNDCLYKNGTWAKIVENTVSSINLTNTQKKTLYYLLMTYSEILSLVGCNTSELMNKCRPDLITYDEQPKWFSDGVWAECDGNPVYFTLLETNLDLFEKIFSTQEKCQEYINENKVINIKVLHERISSLPIEEISGSRWFNYYDMMDLLKNL
jgi:hypothetical protein